MLFLSKSDVQYTDAVHVGYNLVDDDDDDTSATVHQIGELCVWRGERAYRPNDANNFNEAEIEVLIEYLCTS